MTTSPIPAARRLAAAIEPIAGQAQFAPECHANYAGLGFGPSPARVGRTELPDRSAYFTARGSVLGQVPGTVVAAAFAVFNPAVVVPLVAAGWQRTDAAAIWAARQAGAVAQLHRVLGAGPAGPNVPTGPAGTFGADELAAAAGLADLLLEAALPLPLAGRALYAGQRALDVPDEPLARLWRATDTLREYRGDSHIIAWAAEGLDAVEVGLLGDLYWGLAPRAHTAGRGWAAEELTAGEERLRSRGLLAGDRLSAEGFALRDHIERRTDALVEPALAVIGERLDAVVDRLGPWGEAVVAAGAYLSPAVRFTDATPQPAQRSGPAVS